MAVSVRRNQEKREQALRDKDELMQAIAINMQVGVTG